jgi:hypothetical protein
MQPLCDFKHTITTNPRLWWEYNNWCTSASLQYSAAGLYLRTVNLSLLVHLWLLNLENTFSLYTKECTILFHREMQLLESIQCVTGTVKGTHTYLRCHVRDLRCRVRDLRCRVCYLRCRVIYLRCRVFYLRCCVIQHLAT